MRTPKTAFVIEIDAAGDTVAGHLHGRVEHVITGTSCDFESAAALIRFIESMLSQRPPAGDTGRTN